jgi:hypothetical protein
MNDKNGNKLIVALALVMGLSACGVDMEQGAAAAAPEQVLAEFEVDEGGQLGQGVSAAPCQFSEPNCMTWGNYDQMNGYRSFGWVCNRYYPYTTFTVRIDKKIFRPDGSYYWQEIGRGQADRSRSGLESYCGNTNNHGFDIGHSSFNGAGTYRMVALSATWNGQLILGLTDSLIYG